MKKIVKYTTVFHMVANIRSDRREKAEFDKAVNDLIEKGWQPYGSLNVTSQFDNWTGLIFFIQPMVKYTEE